MHRSSLFLTAALAATTVVLGQQVAVAKSTTEVERLAQAVTVKIKLQKDSSVGSGVIIDRVASQQGDLYTLITNRHVVCALSFCQQLPAGEKYSLELPDGKRNQIDVKAIKLIGKDLDLAVLQFHSSRKYAVATVATPGSLQAMDVVYTAGFPPELNGLGFSQGKTIAVVNQRIAGDQGGYSVIYNASTLPGMSGGGVFDQNGQLVAIHGYGDRYKPGTEPDDASKLNKKIGYNRGIPIRWVIQGLGEMGIRVGARRSITEIRATQKVAPTTADEHFIAGFNKFVDPGTDVVAGKKQALQEFNLAIKLNPQYVSAYFMRAAIYDQLQDSRRALSDYSQVIALDPQNAAAYYSRAVLKIMLNDAPNALADYNQAIALLPNNGDFYYNRAILKNILNDLPGALADYNQSIVLNPKDAKAYNNRGNLKYAKLDDIPGALSDFNQALALNPNLATTYFNRGSLKAVKLDDRLGAIQDFRQAARLFRAKGQTKYLQETIEVLRLLGATE
jgi:tetratricopeptide (TPR) repeat protein